MRGTTLCNHSRLSSSTVAALFRHGRLCKKELWNVWWYLPYDDPETGKHFDFEWSGTVAVRVESRCRCPYLTNDAVWVGFNDLATTHPEVVAQWHPTKNGGLTPEMVTAGSNQLAW